METAQWRPGSPAARGSCLDLHVLERPLPASARAVAVARFTARVACRAWRVPQAAEDVALVASELMTATVARTTAPRVVLRLLMTPRRLRLEAYDPSARLVEVRDAAALDVVRALACRSGVERSGPGTRAWAELPLPPAGQAVRTEDRRRATG